MLFRSVCICGGISGTRKIAAIAEAHNALIVPHNPLSPVSTAACLQIAMAVENFAIQELPDHSGISATERYTSANAMDQHSFSQADMVTWVPQVENGYTKANDAPDRNRPRRRCGDQVPVQAPQHRHTSARGWFNSRPVISSEHDGILLHISEYFVHLR